MFLQPKDPSDPSNTQMTRAWPVLCAMYTRVAGGSGKLCQIISLRGLTVPNPGSQSVLRLWNEIHTRLPARCAWSALSCCNLAQSKNIKSFPAVELRLVASTPFTSAKVIAAQLECSTTISTRPPSTGAVVLLSGHFGKYTFKEEKKKKNEMWKVGEIGVASYWYCFALLGHCELLTSFLYDADKEPPRVAAVNIDRYATLRNMVPLVLFCWCSANLVSPWAPHPFSIIFCLFGDHKI